MPISIDPIEQFEIEKQARERYMQVITDSDVRAARYEKWHSYYSPAGGDQWPEDLAERPGKIHLTANLVRRFVDTEARLISIPPRITIPVDDAWDHETLLRGEATEKLFMKYLDLSGFDQWTFTFNQIKQLYGLGVLHPYWDDEAGVPAVEIIEQPQNLLIGWGDSNFKDIDYTIYYSRVSRLQAKLKWGDVLSDEELKKPLSDQGPSRIAGGAHDHDLPEPYDNRLSNTRNQTQYESTQIPVWDYWYIGEEDGTVYNCTLVNGHIVMGPIPHKEMPVIPYIPIESDHEPGSPDGHGTAELLLGLQMAINRTLSLYVQTVWDFTNPAYQLNGEEAPTVVPPGLVPRAGQIVAPGPGVVINPIGGENINNFPMDALIKQAWDAAFKISGLSPVLFGEGIGAQTSGQALQMQLQGVINSIDPKRGRYYEGIRALLKFWHFMLAKKNPKIDGKPVKEVIDGMNRWDLVAPDITPKDVVAHTTNVLDKLNGKLVSLATAMDEIGVENPQQEMDIIRQERGDVNLFPQDAQATAAVEALIQQISGQQQGAPNPNEAAANQAPAQAAAQQASPTATTDQNQPQTQAGSAPPPGAPAPIGATYQPLERFTPNSGPQALSQIQLPQRKF